MIMFHMRFGLYLRHLHNKHNITSRGWSRIKKEDNLAPEDEDPRPQVPRTVNSVMLPADMSRCSVCLMSGAGVGH